ncbi:MAG: bifunctional phosphoribosylaminoimidazolecarboxamide formyltransferase/IMP cyclohydrolase, partial [Spirochaetaceae bacterium]|jgi:phosphoribosylaminoimidazolecarboxamide formyltransferase/IMP cyclohydrolase|nr:bifunctional phosphoribosylaminoimidazolecarboxamide formyltransferase/IMP cyclohydrolase [Spirochaetaceae bacterium]
MLRSAAKNFAGVIVLTDSADYPRAMAEINAGTPDMAFRKMLAGKVFNLTSAYDAAISRFLQSGEAAFPRYWEQPLEKAAELRYGENGHQKAALYYGQDRDGSLKNMVILGGKELSYNNIRDVDLAWKAVCSFGLPAAAHPPLGEAELARLLPEAAGTGESVPMIGGGKIASIWDAERRPKTQPYWVYGEAFGPSSAPKDAARLPRMSLGTNSCACTAVAVKHNTPCGIGSADGALAAFLKARACDPVSIFGGIVAFNCAVDAATAEQLDKIFLEIVAAPAFEPDALAILTRKKNLRILKMSVPPRDEVECVSVDGGLLVQETSRRLFEKWQVVTKAAPPPQDIPELIFGLRAVCWVKSNAIAVVKDGALLGVGGGETNRIWAAELAIKRAAEKTALLAHEPEYAPLSPALRDGRPPAVLASDAFFPFSDVVELAAANGIRSIIQCGGSANDPASIEACNRHGLAMVFTGIRCFKH